MAETATEPVVANFFEGKAEPAPIIITEAPVVEEKKEEVIPPVVENATIETKEEPKIIPPVAEVIPPVEKKTFPNEASENAYNLMVEGKMDELRDVLNEQAKLAGADKLSPADAIKLNLQYKHKDFTPSEINDLFNEQYELPDAPVQRVTETDEEFEERVADHNKEVKKIEGRISRDAKPAVAELLSKKTEIVIPKILNNEPEFKQPSQEELEAEKKKGELFTQSLNEGLTKFSGYHTTFKDEEVEIKVGYKATDEDKKAIQEIVELSNTDAAQFFNKLGWMDDKGQVIASKIIEDLPLILNKEKVFQEIASEMGNQRHAASVKAIKNIDYSGNKTKGDLGETPIQKQEKFVKHFFESV